MAVQHGNDDDNIHLPGRQTPRPVEEWERVCFRLGLALRHLEGRVAALEKAEAVRNR